MTSTEITPITHIDVIVALRLSMPHLRWHQHDADRRTVNILAQLDPTADLSCPRSRVSLEYVTPAFTNSPRLFLTIPNTPTEVIPLDTPEAIASTIRAKLTAHANKLMRQGQTFANALSTSDAPDKETQE